MSKSNRCPVCGKPDWCLVATDGTAAICPRVPSEKRVGDAGWLHKFEDLWQKVEPPPTARLEIPDTAPPGWAEACRECHECIEDYQWDFLCSQTRCSVASLKRLRAGFSRKRGAYTFPMRNGRKQICGVRLRYPNGTKSSAKGSRNGLFMDPVQDIEGRVYLTEGPTDTASLLDIGCTAVGRPSCNAGSKMLLELLPYGVQAIVVADCDEAGRTGAKQIATQLCGNVRSVKVIEPTRGSDANEWVADGATKALIDVIADQAKEFRK